MPSHLLFFHVYKLINFALIFLSSSEARPNTIQLKQQAKEGDSD